MSITLKVTFNPKLQSFSNIGKTPIENASYGMGKTRSNHLKGTQSAGAHVHYIPFHN